LVIVHEFTPYLLQTPQKNCYHWKSLPYCTQESCWIICSKLYSDPLIAPERIVLCNSKFIFLLDMISSKVFCIQADTVSQTVESESCSSVLFLKQFGWLLQVHNALGVSYKKDNRLDKAIQQFEKAVELQPGYVTSKGKS
jgi:hypothetical protein